MKNNCTRDYIFSLKAPLKSGVHRIMDAIVHGLWLHLVVRKPSHRKRIKSATRVFKLLQHPDFRTQPGRFFAYIRKLDPFVFEELLLLGFKSRGLRVVHNTRYTGDGGIDGVVILPNQQRFAVQAKRYQNTINAQHVSDFGHDLKRHGCSGGFFIHSGKSGAGVYQRLPDNVMLISGVHLHRLLTVTD